MDILLNHGKEELRARNLHTALWIPDIFMVRVIKNGNWSLFDITHCPGLSETYGEEFEKLYLKCEEEGRAIKTMRARDLWRTILTRQTQTGHPHICFKDAANKKSNEKNIGIIHSSNLCTEIMEATDRDTVAVCVLGGLNIKKYIFPTYKDKARHLRCHFTVEGYDDLCKSIHSIIDHGKLGKMVRILTRNLTIISEKQFYAIKECKTSQSRTRAIGIGLSGLAELFISCGFIFDSEAARTINREISETIYYNALKESVKLSKEIGPYDAFKGSPASEGKLQFHLWGKTIEEVSSGRHDWKKLIERIKKYGLANSQLIAYMPTATTGSLLGNTQSFQPINSNFMVRRTMAGDFTIVCRSLMEDLQTLGIWSLRMKEAIVHHFGSIQDIECIPAYTRAIYKTAWEIPTSVQQDMSVERGWYTCQSQSLTVFEKDPTYAKMSAILIGAWRKGLKTALYYLRTQPTAAPTKFTVDKERAEHFSNMTFEEVVKLSHDHEDITILPIVADDDVDGKECALSTASSGAYISSECDSCGI